MASIAQLITENGDDLWQYRTADGRGMSLAMQFIYPYIKDKSSWPLAPDILYWDEWPVKHPSLIFASQQLKNVKYINIWKTLEADPSTYEVLRNLPVRHPLLWMNNSGD